MTTVRVQMRLSEQDVSTLAPNRNFRLRWKKRSVGAGKFNKITRKSRRVGALELDYTRLKFIRPDIITTKPEFE